MFGRRDHGKESHSSHAPPIPDYLSPQLETKPERVVVHINGKAYRVSASDTILEACTSNGIHIPTLCHHPALTPTGRCGVCVVHVEGRNPPLQQACKTHVERGMRITTNTPEVLYQAQLNLREFLGTHNLKELNPTPEIEDLVSFVNTGSLVSREQHSHQYAISRTQEQCISCTRCVRACSGIQNMNILIVDPDRPLQPISFEGDLPLHATDCIACGQCVALCPTGAVSERDDVPIVLEQLMKAKEERKIMVIQTAPAARLSVGEIFGDAPGRSPTKTVAALHALGFDYVFDTTFGADLTAHFEAKELAERMAANGPWPMFTSCCPGWVILVEKKYPHLRHLLSHCKSPMMMLAAAIRVWMKHKNIPRERYFSVALMPCTAKKEEIVRSDMKDSEGNYDVDVVLTANEMGRLIKKMGLDWGSLPGSYKTSYDPPFNESSGGGALFPVSGGVTEAALRAAYTIYTNELPRDPDRCLFDSLRKQPPHQSEWVASEVLMTPDRKHKRPIESLVISGARAIQQYLEDSSLDSPAGVKKNTTCVFVECMACPGGCINGGGQPHSLNPNVLKLRREAAHELDHKSVFISSEAAHQKFDPKDVFGLANLDQLRSLMECSYHANPPYLRQQRSALNSPTDSLDSGSENHGKAHKKSSSSSSSSTQSRTTSLASSANFLGMTCILYGTQSGFTASFAKHLHTSLQRSIPDTVSIHSMDHVNFSELKNVETLIILTSTWESDYGLMPENAVKFFAWLTSLPVTSFGSLFRNVKFAVCGFGSTHYREYCGFAVQLHKMLMRLGAYPILDLQKIDVDRSDRGKRVFSMWSKELIKSLQTVSLPAPHYLFVPSITVGSKSVSLATPLNYNVGVVTRNVSYRKVIADGEKYFYLEFDTNRVPFEPASDQYIYILPCNPRAEVENLVNALYPGMLNTPITVLPSSHLRENETGQSEWFPPHLTVRQMFERYVDLNQHPARFFIEQMESVYETSERTRMREILEDPQYFAQWAADKTYYSVLKNYKDVIPPIEVLVTMLPVMQPRCYTPIHLENAKVGSLCFMYKRIDGGLCTNYLSTLKKGDKIVWYIGKSEFGRPNDEIMRPFYEKHVRERSKKAIFASFFMSSNNANPAQAAGSAGSANSSHSLASGASESSSVSNSASPPTIALPQHVSPHSPPTFNLTSSGGSSGSGLFGDSPIQVNVTTLFSNQTKKPGVDELITDSFELSNRSKEKVRFCLLTQETSKYRLTFEPSTGIIKPRFTTRITAKIVVFCTCKLRLKIPVCFEVSSKKNSSQCSDPGSMSEIVLNASVDTKISAKLDFDEIKFNKVIGHGTYGTVSRGEWRGQEVAIKVIKGANTNDESFKRECDLLQELRCQYILNFIGYCILPDKRCLITEYIGLGSLANYIHTALAEEYRFKVALDTAKGMAFLHHCGMMHRDLKPENLLVCSLDPSQQVVVKIADFGASKELSSLKKQTSGVGTPIYMAPEVLEGSTYSTSADVYSFSMLLLELFTGVEPYSNDRFPAPWHIARFISQGRRLPIPTLVPPFIAKLIRVGWKQNPAERPTFDEIITILTNGDTGDDSQSSDSNSDTSSGDDVKEKNDSLNRRGTSPHRVKKHHKHHKHAKEDEEEKEEDGGGDDEDLLPVPKGTGSIMDFNEVTIVDAEVTLPIDADEEESPVPHMPSHVRRLSMSASDYSDSEPLCSPPPDNH